MKRFLTISVFFMIAAGLFAQAPDFAKILKKIDDSMNFDNTDLSGEYTIVSQKPGEKDKVTVARLFRRDAKDQFLILLIKPDSQKGQGYLRIDDTVHFYDPESGNFAFSSLKETFNDSDANNNDFKKSSLVDDYAVKGFTEEKLGKFDCYVVDLEAKTKDVAYAKIKLWIRKDNSLVLKQEQYSLSGRKLRTALFPNYTQLDGNRYHPTSMLFKDDLKPGEQTQITVKDLSTKRLPDSLYTKDYLKKVNN